MTGWMIAACAVLTMVAFTGDAAATVAGEYELKAAFLFNFAKFVEWPSAALSADTDLLTLCVLGEDRFGDGLEKTVEGKKAAGRRLIIGYLTGLRGTEQCHILFVSASEAPPLDQIFAVIEGHAVLTVGETPGFTERGGVIGLGMEEGRVRLTINASAARRAGLRISSKLLRLATVIEPEGSAN